MNKYFKIGALITLVAVLLAFQGTHTILGNINNYIIFASQYRTPGVDACGAINAAASSSLGSGTGPIIVADFIGDQACANNPFPAAYQGVYLFGPATFHTVNTWFLSRKTIFFGMGWAIAFPLTSTGSTVITACGGVGPFCSGAFVGNSAGADLSMVCFSSNATDCGNHGAIFDTPFEYFTVDGNDRPGVILMKNCNAQENSGFFHDNGFNMNNGAGISIGCGGSGAQNSGVDWISLSITSGHTCNNLPAFIVINTGSGANAGPKSIDNITVTAQACKDSAGVSAAPLYAMIAEGGPFSVNHLHTETFQTAAVGVGVDGVVTRAIQLNDINCGPCGVLTGTVPDWTTGSGVTCSVSVHNPCDHADALIKIFGVANTASIGIHNTRMINIPAAGLVPTNTIDDVLNQQTATASEPAIQEYSLGDIGSGNIVGRTSVITTSSQIPTILGGLSVNGCCNNAGFPSYTGLTDFVIAPGALNLLANTCQTQSITNVNLTTTTSILSITPDFSAASYVLETGVVVQVNKVATGANNFTMTACNITAAPINTSANTRFRVVALIR